MADEEKFLSRWARLKREAAAVPTNPAATSGPAPIELPPVDSLAFDSDFTGFLQAKVDEKLKQAALKKLFHSPHFNQMDGLDVYIDDYNTFEPIPEAMLRELNHAQDLLFRQDDERPADNAVPSVGPIAAEPAVDPAILDAPDIAPASQESLTADSAQQPASDNKS